MVRVRRETVVLALCCLFGIVAAGGCSGNVETGPGSDVDAAGGSAGRGGSSGRGGGAGRSGGGGLDTGGAAGIGGTVAGAAGSSAGFAGSGVGGVSGRSAGGAPGRGGAAGVGGISGAGGSSTGACGPATVTCAVVSDPVPASAPGGETISPATNDVLGCLLNGARADGGIGTDCFVQCFSGD